MSIKHADQPLVPIIWKMPPSKNDNGEWFARYEIVTVPAGVAIGAIAEGCAQAIEAKPMQDIAKALTDRLEMLPLFTR